MDDPFFDDIQQDELFEKVTETSSESATEGIVLIKQVDRLFYSTQFLYFLLVLQTWASLSWIINERKSKVRVDVMKTLRYLTALAHGTAAIHFKHYGHGLLFVHHAITILKGRHRVPLTYLRDYIDLALFASSVWLYVPFTTETWPLWAGSLTYTFLRGFNHIY